MPLPPTAIIGANDSIALAALDAAQSLGVKVPSELSIIGFDDDMRAGQSTPALTTVRQPLFEIGVAAAEILVQLIGGNHNENQCRLLTPKLILRGTTCVAQRH